MKVTLSELEELVEKALTKYGYDADESQIIKEVLMYAQLRGNNQGVVKLIGAGIPKRDEAGEMSIVKETGVSALVDAGAKHAMLGMNYATELAIQKAKESGIGITGNFNASESTGALGYYVEKIAKEGLIGVAYAASPFMTTAPYGANEPRYCTNPIAYAVPTLDDPIILDFTTSAVAYYGLIEAKTAGKPIDEGCGFDAEGKPTTDAAEIMGGAISTMADHKGSGLAFMVQVLAGALVQADSFDNDSDNSGNFVMAFDPEILTDSKSFIKNVSAMADNIKSARKADGFDEVLLPGERGNRVRSASLAEGEIEIEENLLDALKKVV